MTGDTARDALTLPRDLVDTLPPQGLIPPLPLRLEIEVARARAGDALKHECRALLASVERVATTDERSALLREVAHFANLAELAYAGAAGARYDTPDLERAAHRGEPT